MEAKSKENGSRLEESEHLCVSPGVIETVPPEEVSAAVLRHLRVDGLEVRERGEKEVNDRVRSIARYGGRRSIHRSSEGIAFWVVTEFDEPFINVLLPGES